MHRSSKLNLVLVRHARATFGLVKITQITLLRLLLLSFLLTYPALAGPQALTGEKDLMELRKSILLKRHSEAVRRANQLLSKDPDNRELTYLNAYAYWRNGQNYSARRILERALAGRGSIEQFWLAVEMAAQKGDDEQVIELWMRFGGEFTKQLTAGPKGEEIVSNVILAFVHLDRARDGVAALSSLLKSWKKSERSGKIFFDSCLLFSLAKERADALEFMKRALAAGYELEAFRNDPDLATIERTSEFKHVIGEYVSRGDVDAPGIQREMQALAALDANLGSLQPAFARSGVLKAESAERAKNLLAERWGIQSDESLKKTLEWLRSEGHSKAFGEAEQGKHAHGMEWRKGFAAEHSSAVGSKLLKGWDLVREHNLVRLAWLAGLMGDAAAYESMEFTGQAIRTSFSSWDELAHNYVLGRYFKEAPVDMEEDREFFEKVEYLRHSPDSPWTRIQFRLDPGDAAQESGKTVEPTGTAVIEAVPTPLATGPQPRLPEPSPQPALPLQFPPA